MPNSEFMGFVELLLKYLIVPLGAFQWALHKTQNAHEREIAVLNAKREADKQAHDREIVEIRQQHSAIMVKLSSIEEALRK